MQLAAGAGGKLYPRRAAGPRAVVGVLGEVAEGELAVLVLADAHFLGRPTWGAEPVLESQLHVDVLIGGPGGADDGQLRHLGAEVAREQVGKGGRVVFSCRLDDAT